MLRILLFLAVILVSAHAQDPPVDKVPDGDALLAQIDKRIYYPCENGLRSFRFRMSMDHGTGQFADALKGLFMSVSWQAPDHWRLGLVDGSGKALKTIPKVFATENGRKILKAWQKDIQGMAQHLMVGVPLRRKYARHLKKVKRRIVNNKVEYRISLYPDRRRSYTEAVMRVVNGLPRKLEYVDSKGGRFVTRFLYAQRREKGGRWLWTGVDQEAGSRRIRQEEYEYLTRSGILLLSRLKRLDHVGVQRKVEFKVESLEVNLDFPKGYFKKPGPSSRPH